MRFSLTFPHLPFAIMITKSKKSLIFLALLGAGCLTFAQEQEKDTLSQKGNDVKIIKAKETPLDTVALDTLAMDMQGLDQMEEMQSAVPFEDMPLSFTQERDKNKYGLQDHSEAAKYDSLWMKELYEAAALFDDMYDEVAHLDKNVENDSDSYILELPTDTLKARLSKLNQKTPFNVLLKLNALLQVTIKTIMRYTLLF